MVSLTEDKKTREQQAVQSQQAQCCAKISRSVAGCHD